MTVGSVCSGMPRRSRLTNTPATWPRSAAVPVSFSTIEARISASSARLQRQSSARARPRPLRAALLHRAHRRACSTREVARALAVGVGVREEAPFGRHARRRRARPSPPRRSAPRWPASAARPWPARRGPGGRSSLRSGARRASVSSPRTILSSSRRGVVPGAELVAAGADLARLARPAEPFVEQRGGAWTPASDPGLRDLARRRAGLDRQLDRDRRPAAAAGAATSQAAQAAAPPRRAASSEQDSARPSSARDDLASARAPAVTHVMAADDNRRMTIADVPHRRRLPARRLGRDPRRGADAAKFLHGQLTKDVAQPRPGQARLAGFCSAKGRLQASFVGLAGRGRRVPARLPRRPARADAEAPVDVRAARQVQARAMPAPRSRCSGLAGDRRRRQRLGDARAAWAARRHDGAAA